MPISWTNVMFQLLPCETGCGKEVPLCEPDAMVSWVKVTGMPSQLPSIIFFCSAFCTRMRQAGSFRHVALGQS